jgi:hypothetical protein
LNRQVGFYQPGFANFKTTYFSLSRIRFLQNVILQARHQDERGILGMRGKKVLLASLGSYLRLQLFRRMTSNQPVPPKTGQSLHGKKSKLE